MVNINKAHDLQISSIVTVNKVKFVDVNLVKECLLYGEGNYIIFVDGSTLHYVIKFEAFILSSISGNLYIVCAFMECGLTGLAATSKFIGPHKIFDNKGHVTII
ncbi:hypothetical protein H5410_057905 [Solanum commersonii]|uniref:Uncharacterized protein n=1 Tax=Solanum commersonii TaxID=4109 RepID=A0A9J5WP67_SOLCO|nr:hypothetical protein H5410_057905 [Solanum commersonii]